MVLVGLQTPGGGYLAFANFGNWSTEKKAMSGDSLIEMNTKDEGKTWSLQWANKGGKFIKTTHSDKEPIKQFGSEGDKGTDFQVTYEPNGFVTFYNSAENAYLSWQNGVLTTCGTPSNKSGATENCRWMIVLSLTPQQALLNGTQFMSLKGEALECRRPHQFGTDSVFTFEKSETIGSYHIKAANENYLAVNGTKVSASGKDVGSAGKFSIRVHFLDGNEGWVIFNIDKAQFLNNNGGLSGKETAKTFWRFVNSTPQFSLRAANNNYVSVEGQNVIVSKTEINMDDNSTEVYAFSSMGKGYEIAFPETNGHVKKMAKDGNALIPAEKGTEWQLEYKDGRVAINADGKYWKSAKIGGVSCNGSGEAAECWFEFALANRDNLVLKKGQMFLAPKKGKVAGSVTAAAFSPDFVRGDVCHYVIKDPASGQFWSTSGDETVLASSGSKYFLEVHGDKLAVRLVEGGQFLGLDSKTGKVGPTADSPTDAVLFEF